MSQVIKVSSCELTLVTTERQVGVPNTGKYSPDVSGMLVPAVAETDDVVEVCPGEVVHSMEQLYHKWGECGWCIPQSKRHIAPLHPA